MLGAGSIDVDVVSARGLRFQSWGGFDGIAAVAAGGGGSSADSVEYAVPLDRKCVLTGRDIACIGTAHPEAFQTAHQGAVTATRLGERAHASQPLDQRQHRRTRRRVEIGLRAF